MHAPQQGAAKNGARNASNPFQHDLEEPLEATLSGWFEPIVLMQIPGWSFRIVGTVGKQAITNNKLNSWKSFDPDPWQNNTLGILVGIAACQLLFSWRYPLLPTTEGGQQLSNYLEFKPALWLESENCAVQR